MTHTEKVQALVTEGGYTELEAEAMLEDMGMTGDDDTPKEAWDKFVTPFI